MVCRRRLLVPSGVELIDAGLRFGDDGGRDAPVHGREVRIELHDAVGEGGFFELLFDLGEVPVLWQAVGLHALVSLAVNEVFGDFPTCAADAAVAVDDDAFRLDEPCFEQWNKGTWMLVG